VTAVGQSFVIWRERPQINSALALQALALSASRHRRLAASSSGAYRLSSANSTGFVRTQRLGFLVAWRSNLVHTWVWRRVDLDRGVFAARRLTRSDQWPSGGCASDTPSTRRLCHLRRLVRDHHRSALAFPLQSHRVARAGQAPLLAHCVPVSRPLGNQSSGDGLARGCAAWLLRDLTSAPKRVCRCWSRPRPLAGYRRWCLKRPMIGSRQTSRRRAADHLADYLLAQDCGRMLPIEPAAENGADRGPSGQIAGRATWEIDPDRMGQEQPAISIIVKT